MLLGESESGKTTTFNLVYDTLLQEIDVNTDIIEPRQQLGGNPNDFECVLRYKGRIIGFYSMGDFPHRVGLAISRYRNRKKCDIFVFAMNNDREGWEGHIENENPEIVDKNRDFVESNGISNDDNRCRNVIITHIHAAIA